MKIKSFSERCFVTASYLTDMPCHADRDWKLSQIVPSTDPHKTPSEQAFKSLLLRTKACAYGAMSLLTAVPGIALRQLGIFWQDRPWLEEHSLLSKKRSFSVLFWNICGPGGGYSISDGGVLPLWKRIDALIDRIVEKNADVNCLCEVFDVQHAKYLVDKLKDRGYVDFYYHIHPLPIGVSSGLFIASKFQTKHPEFLRFPLETLVGRTKNAAKGAFFFDLVDAAGKVFATIGTTHMQHSEECAFPTQEEIEARQAQMKMIQKKIESIAKDRVVFFCGDLNGIPEEFSDELSRSFDLGNLLQDVQSTWAGDEFCANFVGKKVSGPLFYDYAMIRKGDLASIQTEKVDSFFDPAKFSSRPYSDHDGLLSRITYNS